MKARLARFAPALPFAPLFWLVAMIFALIALDQYVQCWADRDNKS